jgi:16S rRNA (adenine1518-N6/adenine1519-N6)-dimethyltransferase
MNLASPATVRELMARLGMQPSKAMGQNFLIDRNTVDTILDAAQVAAGESILEIGPGLGIMTETMLARGAHVRAIEKDSKLAAHLKVFLGSQPNFTLIHGDALELTEQDAEEDTPAFVPDRVVSNLPYSVGTRILVALTLGATPPPFIAVTLQDEVVARMTAQAGSSEYGMLSILMQAHYDVHRVRGIKPTCFWPKPDVSSAFVVLSRSSILPRELRVRLCQLLKVVFASRRKQLHSTLDRVLMPEGGHGLGSRLLEAIQVDPLARPENLTPREWLALVRNIQNPI